jgi:hypothetical protein
MATNTSMDMPVATVLAPDMQNAVGAGIGRQHRRGRDGHAAGPPNGSVQS